MSWTSVKMIKIPKNIKMIITDGDGTLYAYKNEPYQSSWDALGMCLVRDEREKWFKFRDFYIDKMKEIDKQDIDEEEKRAKKSKIEESWFKEDLRLLKGYHIDYFKKQVFPVPYEKGAKKFFLSAPQDKIIGILSAGVDFIIEQAARELGMDFFVCSKLYKKRGILIGNGKDHVNLLNKPDILKKLCKKYGVLPEDVCYFGDHFNCKTILEKVGLGIAVNPKDDAVRKAAKFSTKNFCEVEIER